MKINAMLARAIIVSTLLSICSQASEPNLLGHLSLIAPTGQIAPDTGGARFASVSQARSNSLGQIGFRADLVGAIATDGPSNSHSVLSRSIAFPSGGTRFVPNALPANPRDHPMDPHRLFIISGSSGFGVQAKPLVALTGNGLMGKMAGSSNLDDNPASAEQNSVDV